MAEFPKRVYVEMVHEGGEIYPVTHTDFDYIEETKELGVYELKETRTLKVSVSKQLV